MSDLSFRDVRKKYGNYTAVDGVNLSLERGEFVTLLGPSGCGKSTCLRMVAGFVTPSSGSISLDGREVTKLPPHRRNTGMVFQSYALFPHLTVAQNIAFGLEVRRLSRAEREERVGQALRLVRLERFADRYPSQLSGGQRQRVALARAVVINPDVLLLDEPLGALDLKLREELQVEIKRVQTELNMTTLFVTHDQGEALSMSSRIAVMREGQIVQIGTPSDIYARPNSRYVASFVGRINLMPVKVREAGEQLCHVVPAQALQDASPFVVTGREVARFAREEGCLLAVRPEHLKLGEGDEGWNRASMVVTQATYLGHAWHIEGQGRDGSSITVLAGASDAIPTAGSSVGICWRPEQCFLLKPE